MWPSKAVMLWSRLDGMKKVPALSEVPLKEPLSFRFFILRNCGNERFGVHVESLSFYHHKGFSKGLHNRKAIPHKSSVPVAFFATESSVRGVDQGSQLTLDCRPFFRPQILFLCHILKRGGPQSDKERPI